MKITLLKGISLALFGLALNGAAQAELSQAEWAQQGKMVASAADCQACHTNPGGQPFAGGYPIHSPMGTIFTTNITPSKQFGIGNYTEEQFARAVRQGVRPDGKNLYPAMPYTSYAKMSDKDMRALYTYLMDEVKPQPEANRENPISWPLSMRWPLRVWNSLFLSSGEFKPRADQSEEWNRGAYLVQGAGHCGACHTPRGWAQQEKAEDESDAKFLSGGELDGWYAPSLHGIKGSQQELVTLLKTGRNTHAAVSGPMGEVITNSTQFMTDADLNSMAVYLLSLKSEPAASPAKPAQVTASGQQTYARYCSTCHGTQGEGQDFNIPALAGNVTVTSPNPQTLLRVILSGGQTPVTAEHMSKTMPGYGWALNDQQVAELTNTLRDSWGNQAEAVTAEQVKAARDASK